MPRRFEIIQFTVYFPFGRLTQPQHGAQPAGQ
jgi:hypothetical protein